MNNRFIKKNELPEYSKWNFKWNNHFVKASNFRQRAINFKMVLKLMLTEEHSFLDGRALSLFEVWQPWDLTQEGEVHRRRPDFELISLYAFQITLEILVAVTQTIL